jgi:hypothetical protein
MAERVIRYGKFKIKDGWEHCLAVVQYSNKMEYSNETEQFEKVGETIHGVYRVRGGWNYAKKYGITKCGRYSSLQALIDDDVLTYSNLDFEFYEPITI